jgi:hypothetical protein
VIGRPVLVRAFRTSVTVAVGFFCFRTAQAPATWGTANDVPLPGAKAPPGTDEVIDCPGARSERNDAEFEKDETISAFVVDPTLTAVEIQAGALMPSVNPSFPEAAIVAMPIERRLSIAAFLAASCSSHGEVNFAAPTLRLTAANVYWFLKAKTHSKPAT